MTTADLVITDGTYNHSIVIFRPYSISIDVTSGDAAMSADVEGLMRNFIWKGATSRDYVALGNGVGVELEKPFSDGGDGIYFMMEMFFASISSDDWDALCHWDATHELTAIALSTTELEVENPPLDGSGGFYFVQSYADAKSVDITNKTGQVQMVTVKDLGTFGFPPSVFESASTDTAALALEMLQSEHGFLEAASHDILFVGAGPVGGNMSLTALKWTDATKPNLTSKDVIKAFKNKDLGGYAEIATALVFSDNVTIYTISYDLGGGEFSGDQTSPTHYSDYGSGTTPEVGLINPVKAGYTFADWTGTDLDAAAATVTIAKGSYGDRSYTATWTSSGGSNDDDTQTVTAPTMGQSSYTMSVRRGQDSSLAISAIGESITWTMSGTLPAGMTFSSSGDSATISGTPEPTASGTYEVTVTAANTAGTVSANVTITVTGGGTASRDVKPEASTPVTTTLADGRTQTYVETVFRNEAGLIVMTSNVAITVGAPEVDIKTGETFTTVVEVDAALEVEDPILKEYHYAMNIDGLPEWLSTAGELEVSETVSGDFGDHHHEFTLSGTPSEAGTADLSFNAVITVSRGSMDLEAGGTAAMKITVTGPTVSPDVSPDVRPTSPDVRPTSPDVRPESPDQPTPTPTPGTDSGDTPAPTPTPGTDQTSGPARLDTPRMNITNIAANVLGTLRSLNSAIPQGTEVMSLPESAAGSPRSISDLSSEDLANIPETENVAGVLPIMVVTKSAVYVFGITLGDLRAGAAIFLHMMGENTSGAMVSSSAAETEAYTFLDDDGNEVTTLPVNKHVNIAAYMESGKTYAPLVTTEAASGGEDIHAGPGSSSGGCDSGFSVLGLVLAVLGLAVGRKR